MTEHEWLEWRKNPDNIKKWNYPCSNPLTYDRMSDFIQAIEFEARVERELTEPNGDYMPFCMPEDCDFHERGNCRACRLKYARLAVEAEMDAQNK